MRILFLTQFFQPEPMFKGLSFARALRERGHTVEVLTGFPNYPGGKLYAGYRIRPVLREVIDGIPVTRVPLIPNHNQSSIGRMANYLSFAGSAATIGAVTAFRPDVIYVYNLVTLGPAWQVLRLRHRCAVVLDVQDLWPESVSNSGMMRSPWLNRVLASWCRRMYRSPDRLTVLSPGFKKHLEGLGVPGDRIDVIYNWCEEWPRMMDAQAESLRREAGFHGRFNVLFAGTMGKMQALEPVISAARIVEKLAPEVQFSFLGGGIEVDRLKHLSIGMRNVRFLERRSPAEAFALSAAADALLVHLKDDPLFSITIPSKTQVYLHVGRPILMGVRGDAAALVRQADAGLCFQPENPDEIARAVVELVKKSPAERQRLGANGRRFYESHLSFSFGVSHFERVFQAAHDRACSACGSLSV